MELNIKEILERLGIDYSEEHKNVSQNCIGIAPCPFPECGDDKYHAALFLDTGRFTCWKCKNTVSFFKFLNMVAGISKQDFEKIIGGDKFKKDTLARIREIYGLEEAGEVITKRKPPPCVLPGIPVVKTYTDEWDSSRGLLSSFLFKRLLSIKTCVDYNCNVTQGIGDYPHRLIIPVYDEKGNLATWQGRDITGNANKPYINPKHFPMHNYIYGIEKRRKGDTLIICEGVFDAWRLEPLWRSDFTPLATFGKSLSKEQRSILYGHISFNEVQRIIFAWDSDAYRQALKEASWFSAYIPSKALRFPEGEDPDSLGANMVETLINETSYL